MAIDGLAGLARKLADEIDRHIEDENVLLRDYVLGQAERVLRESKLPELIAAGQGMREAVESDHDERYRDRCDICKGMVLWNEALAAFLAATDSVDEPSGSQHRD